jgi:hypothetical protein
MSKNNYNIRFRSEQEYEEHKHVLGAPETYYLINHPGCVCAVYVNLTKDEYKLIKSMGLNIYLDAREIGHCDK